MSLNISGFGSRPDHQSSSAGDEQTEDHAGGSSSLNSTLGASLNTSEEQLNEPFVQPKLLISSSFSLTSKLPESRSSANKKPLRDSDCTILSVGIPPPRARPRRNQDRVRVPTMKYYETSLHLVAHRARGRMASKQGPKLGGHSIGTSKDRVEE